jgi:hypothetical protein
LRERRNQEHHRQKNHTEIVKTLILLLIFHPNQKANQPVTHAKKLHQLLNECIHCATGAITVAILDEAA